MRSPTEPVIVAAARTPIGKRGGALSALRPDDLGALLVRELLDRAGGLDPATVDDLVVGCATPVGEQGWNIARQMVLAAGLPVSVPGVTVNRMCASGDQALRYGSWGIAAGEADVVLACGVESMSRVPMTSDGTSFSDRVSERFRLVQQGLSAELMAEKWGLSRKVMDGFSLESHRRAVAAQRSGAFERELLPVEAVGEGGVVVKLASDEGPRPGTTMERLSQLRPAFQDPGSVTAGNSSQMSDGAAGVVVMSSARAAELGLAPRARLVRSVTVGADPVLQLAGVIDATRHVLARAGLSAGDIDHYEVNEAFAAVPLAWLAETGVPASKLNPRGGSVSLGHPLGATGTRLTVTMLHALEDSGGRYGLQAMCIGHGMANATIIERLDH